MLMLMLMTNFWCSCNKRGRFDRLLRCNYGLHSRAGLSWHCDCFWRRLGTAGSARSDEVEADVLWGIPRWADWCTCAWGRTCNRDLLRRVEPWGGSSGTCGIYYASFHLRREVRRKWVEWNHAETRFETSCPSQSWSQSWSLDSAHQRVGMTRMRVWVVDSLPLALVVTLVQIRAKWGCPCERGKDGSSSSSSSSRKKIVCQSFDWGYISE